MKKLGKLSINPEKVIKNEELVNLRGGCDGYGDNDEIACWCLDKDSGVILGPAVYGGWYSQDEACRELYPVRYDGNLRCRTF